MAVPKRVGGDGFKVDPGLLLIYVASVALVSVLLVLDSDADWTEVGPALAIQVVIGALLACDARRSTQSRTSTCVVCIVAYMASVALLRDGGGAVSGFGPLALLPVVWASLRGRRTELFVAVAGVAAIFILPAAFVGAPQYPAGTWRAGVLFTGITAVLGIANLRLVARVDNLVARLHELARTDELTGLPNRRAWREMLERDQSTARRTGRPLVVALLDLNSFKDYNDSHGHLAADRMLCHATATWLSVLRDCDALARWGGDEFGLLLPNCDAGYADAVLDRMRAACPAAPFAAGVVEWDGRGDADTIVTAADRQLYDAKHRRTARTSKQPARTVRNNPPRRHSQKTLSTATSPSSGHPKRSGP